ncbi:MAG: tetratricopeptide repeat protein [Anaeromyxobacteraceae bacterium]
MWSYRTSEVARMLGLTAAQVRELARAGLGDARRGPRGELRFSFHDLVLLRAARELVRARVPAARVKRALARARQQLPAGRSLAAMRIAADGDRVVVRDGAGAWHPESGQALFDFAVADVAAEVAPLLARSAEAAPRGADEFFEWGCELEDGAPDQARDAYGRALAADPAHYGANLNLGRLLHDAGDAAAAERHYRRALAARPGDAVALFNLGVALEDRGAATEALEAYEASLAADPAHGDAHHNAARLAERLGRRDRAVRHLAAWRRLR